MINLILVALCLIIFLFILKAKARFHLFKRVDRWAIAIYIGNSPYRLTAPYGLRNPVLTARDVTDRKAEFVADPFMVKEGDSWHMFFEVMDNRSRKGEIGLAISRDGFHWKYKQIILSEPFHLSYPYIFKWENEYYLIPESYQANSIRLYKAANFPYEWLRVADLLTGSFSDSSIFRYGNKWWMFTLRMEEKSITNDTLLLYFSDNLFGPWKEHPKSPIIQGNPHIARPAGRVLVLDGKVLRFAQDDFPIYGARVFTFQITELTSLDYGEKEFSGNPILGPSGKGWNKDGMHTIDLHPFEGDKWIACVDGNARYRRLREIRKKKVGSVKQAG